MKSNMLKKIVPIVAASVFAMGALTGCSSSKPADAPAATEASADSEAGDSASTTAKAGDAFPEFQGKDLEGNAIDNSIFKNNSFTVLSFWFNGCTACVNEMPTLQKLNESIKEKGGELIGVNVEAGTDESSASEAASILEKQGASYRNIGITGGDKALDYINNIMSFPEIVVVDQNGNIIGKPIDGNVEDSKTMDQLQKLIDEAVQGK